jgi:hypothetical protein
VQALTAPRPKAGEEKVDKKDKRKAKKDEPPDDEERDEKSPGGWLRIPGLKAA